MVAVAMVFLQVDETWIIICRCTYVGRYVWGVLQTERKEVGQVWVWEGMWSSEYSN